VRSASSHYHFWIRQYSDNAYQATRRRLAMFAHVNGWSKIWILNESRESLRIQEIARQTGIPLTKFDVMLFALSHLNDPAKWPDSVRCGNHNRKPFDPSKNYVCILCDSLNIYSRVGLQDHMRMVHRRTVFSNIRDYIRLYRDDADWTLEGWRNYK